MRAEDKTFPYDGKNVSVTPVMEAYTAHVNAELVAELAQVRKASNYRSWPQYKAEKVVELESRNVELVEALNQALRQWKMYAEREWKVYAEDDRSPDLEDGSDSEAQLYKSLRALAKNGGKP